MPPGPGRRAPRLPPGTRVGLLGVLQQLGEPAGNEIAVTGLGVTALPHAGVRGGEHGDIGIQACRRGRGCRWGRTECGRDSSDTRPGPAPPGVRRQVPWGQRRWLVALDGSLSAPIGAEWAIRVGQNLGSGYDAPRAVIPWRYPLGNVDPGRTRSCRPCAPPPLGPGPVRPRLADPPARLQAHRCTRSRPPSPSGRCGW